MSLFAQDKQDRDARRLYKKDPNARRELAALKERGDAEAERLRQQYLADEREIVSKYRKR